MNWEPFIVSHGGQHGDPPRSLDTFEGVGDRLRSAAFAEIQAREAFLWAAGFFEDAPEPLRSAWRALAKEEHKHLGWLLGRMEELQVEIRARKVSDMLWHSLRNCKTAKEFAIYMANAEERGRRAGERFHQALTQRDPVTAEIFRKIAEEEVSHIELARKYFPEN